MNYIGEKVKSLGRLYMQIMGKKGIEEPSFDT